MSILGSLIVNLTANTASFIDGMSGAAKTAKTVGRDIESTFSSLGNVATTALAPFGDLGAAVGHVLDGVGVAASRTFTEVAKLGGGLGIVAGIGGGAAAALGAVAAGTIAIAAHATK